MAAPWLLVFVKAPTPGRVKTRCRPDLSPDQGACLYRALIRDTFHAAAAIDPTIHVVVAYAADERFPDLAWLDPGLPIVRQQGATLGERLTRAIDDAFARGAASVTAIGSDAPELSAAWLDQAVRALSRHDLVLGPTDDGGYHLIGLTRPQPSLFRDMPWSQPRLLARTLAEAQRLGLSVHQLEPIVDLDTPADLRRYRAGVGSIAQTETARLLRTMPLRHGTALRPLSSHTR